MVLLVLLIVDTTLADARDHFAVSSQSEVAGMYPHLTILDFVLCYNLTSTKLYIFISVFEKLINSNLKFHLQSAN